MPKWQWILKYFTSKLWLRATFFCLMGVFTALFGLLVKDYIPQDISRMVGANAVDTILEIIASSMLVVTTFSLSTMVAAYSAASSNAPPRATKLLMQDSVAQNALSIFIGSFLYSLVGIIALKMDVYGEDGRLVLFAVTLVVIFFITAVLLQWIDHLATLGRVGETINMIESAAKKAILQHTEEPFMGGVPLREYMPVPAHIGIRHETIGNIQHIDMAALHGIAQERGVDIFIRTLPGDYNDSCAPVAYCSAPLEKDDCRAIGDAFTIRGDRSFDQDPRYGLIVMGEIASRALSPSMNDTGTAIDVVDTLVRLMALWVSAPLPKEGAMYPGVYVPAIRLADVFDDAFHAIARDGAAKIEVGVRLQKAFSSLAAMGGEECKKQATQHSSRALKRALQALTLQEDKDRLLSVALAKA